MKSLTAILFLILTIAAAAATFWAAHTYFGTEELQRANARLSLYRSTVDAELKRFSHLSVILARDTYVIDTAMGADPSQLNARLSDFAKSAGVDAIYLSGLTLPLTRYANKTCAPLSHQHPAPCRINHSRAKSPSRAQDIHCKRHDSSGISGIDQENPS